MNNFKLLNQQQHDSTLFTLEGNHHAKMDRSYAHEPFDIVLICFPSSNCGTNEGGNSIIT